MPVKFHGLEKHSLEPILIADELDLDMSFTKWNSLVGEKKRQHGIAQHLGETALAQLDQEDINMLYKIFPDFYTELVHIDNHDILVNE